MLEKVSERVSTAWMEANAEILEENVVLKEQNLELNDACVRYEKFVELVRKQTYHGLPSAVLDALRDLDKEKS